MFLLMEPQLKITCFHLTSRNKHNTVTNWVVFMEGKRVLLALKKTARTEAALF